MFSGRRLNFLKILTSVDCVLYRSILCENKKGLFINLCWGELKMSLKYEGK